MPDATLFARIRFRLVLSRRTLEMAELKTKKTHVEVGSDHSSPDTLVSALYEVVSGPAGVEPDWERERSLYLPGALLVRATQVREDSPTAAVMDVESFIAVTILEITDRVTPQVR